MRLGVNVDHVATVRQARRGAFPDPVEAARICQRSGADSIVCHLREDRRHIQDEDVRRLKRELSIPLNLEMSIAQGIVEVALDVKPSQVTLVPERRQELTTEGGLDVVRLEKRLRPLIKSFAANGIQVSLFVDPVRDQLVAARDAGASIVELHTGGYATAEGPQVRERELAALRQAAAWGREAGLSIAAGHGLHYDNIRPIIEIPEIEEVNIGFSIIGQALFSGLERAVRDMVELLQRNSDALRAA
jgi:pyridoxine 5-phosphate synthase